MPSHIVFGAGLIGGYVGGVLTGLGQPTKLVCRPKVKAKLKDGFLLTDYQQNELIAANPQFLNKQDFQQKKQGEIPCDFLWITVKCTAVAAVSKEIAPLVGENTIILCCQNGLGSDQIIKEQFSDNTVLRVMVPFNVSEPKAGHLHRGSEGTLVIESPKKNPDVVTALVKQINSSIMPVSTTTEMDALLWAKLQLNLGNSVNALANIPVKSMLEQRPYRLVNALLMKELLQVTKALGIRLPKLTKIPANRIPLLLRLPNFIYLRLTQNVLTIDPTVRSSMWWDLNLGRKTEIDYLNGAVVEHAEKLGLSCTTNKNIIRLIKEAEKIPVEQRKGIAGSVLFEKLK